MSSSTSLMWAGTATVPPVEFGLAQQLQELTAEIREMSERLNAIEAFVFRGGVDE